MRKIIGLNGLIGSGKDTVADNLIAKHNFKRLTFATKLKDSVAELFDIDREKLEGLTKESREWRDKPLEFWSKELKRDVTPRYLLQQIGTECMRRGFYEDIWVSFVKKELYERPDENFVITDMRFTNEVEMIRSLGGDLWSVRRGEFPMWWEDAVRWNHAIWTRGHETGLENPFANSPICKGPWHHIHATEWGLAGYEFDFTLDNNGTFEELFELTDLRIL